MSMGSETFRARITEKNQLTLPAEVVVLLGVKTGDELRFEVTAEGIMLSPIPVRERLAPLIGRRRRGSGKTRDQIDADVSELRGDRATTGRG